MKFVTFGLILPLMVSIESPPHLLFIVLIFLMSSTTSSSSSISTCTQSQKYKKLGGFCTASTKQ